MLSIPNLYDTPFQRIEAGLTIPADRLTVNEGLNLLHEFCDREAPMGLTAQLPGERPLFVSVKVEQSPDFGSDDLEARPQVGEIHAEVSISIVNPFEGSPRYKSFYIKNLSSEFEQTDPVSIWEPLALFLETTVDLYVEGSFSVERRRIPPQSLVASMIGLRTVAGEEQFLLSGAQFAVRGFPDDTVSWYLEPGSSGQKVAGRLVRQWVDQFRWESICDAVHVIEARYNRVMLAQSSIGTHVTA